MKSLKEALVHKHMDNPYQKYEITNNTIKRGSIILHQIRALKDIKTSVRNVSAGNIGGWVELEKNLSQNGDCWIHDSAVVFGNAKVDGNAEVHGFAKVYGNAKVFGNAEVYSDAQVYGNAKLCGNAKVDYNVNKGTIDK